VLRSSEKDTNPMLTRDDQRVRHTITYHRLDGTVAHVTLVATEAHLRDDEYVLAACERVIRPRSGADDPR
jgi:hypothetical protein